MIPNTVPDKRAYVAHVLACLEAREKKSHALGRVPVTRELLEDTICVLYDWLATYDRLQDAGSIDSLYALPTDRPPQR